MCVATRTRHRFLSKVQQSMNSVSGGELGRSVVVTSARYVVLRLFFVAA